MHARFGAAFVAAFMGFLIVSSGESVFSQPPAGKGKDFKGGFGPPGGQTRKLVKDFDKNGDGWLNQDERVLRPATRPRAAGLAARGSAEKALGVRAASARAANPADRGQRSRPATWQLSERQASTTRPSCARIFLEFENKDWEAELQDFHGTDVEVPATLTVDGKKYPNVGVHFRGMSSYMGVPAGLEAVAQRLARLRRQEAAALRLQDAQPAQLPRRPVADEHGAVLAHRPAVHPGAEGQLRQGRHQRRELGRLHQRAAVRQGVPEGELQDRRRARGGRSAAAPAAAAGWSTSATTSRPTSASSRSRRTRTRRRGRRSINLCKVLNQTPPDKLEAALAPILRHRRRCCGSWRWTSRSSTATATGRGPATTASTWTTRAKFHIIPHDMNEASGRRAGPAWAARRWVHRGPPPGEILPPPVQDMLQLTEEQKKQLAELQKEVDAKLDKLLTEEQRKQFKEMKRPRPRWPGLGLPGGLRVGRRRLPADLAASPAGLRRMGGGGRGVELDPLVGLDDARKPLRSKLLAVPALKAKYLANVQEDRRGFARLEEARAGGVAVPQADREGSRDRHAEARLVRGVQAATPTTRAKRRRPRSRFRPGDEPPGLRRTTGKVPSRPSAQEAVKAHL